MKVLLDTCVLLWLITGERKLSARVSSSVTTGDLWLSAASVWEIAVKFSKGALRLPVPPDRLIAAARERYGISSLPIDEESAIHVVKLPALHADPFDRMLVSQAIVHGLTIVTPDPLVTQYPARTLW
ncbi:MAG TPA: type II toxin-antitoxin system VapC family toxin [Vicinamibacterales bacterium]|nr:type II toxin-antitoxin system VapC family toxin [Vicinamibacterales bacterium]